MASQQVTSSQQFNPYLSPNQQDLLLAALNSQATSKARAKAALGDTGVTNQATSDVLQHSSSTMSGSAVFQSPGNMDNFNPDFTPDLDYLDGDGSFDFDNADLGGEMIGGLPDLDAEGNPEQHEKRKNTDEDGSPEEGDAKRQELGEGEKGSKKPGRKPLTNEPTTVSTHSLLPRYYLFFLPPRDMATHSTARICHSEYCLHAVTDMQCSRFEDFIR
jgi:AP-1-like factor